MEDSLDGTVGAVTELFTELELIHVDGERRPIREVDPGGMYNRFAVKIERARWITIRWVSGYSRSRTRRTYTIFPKFANGVFVTAAGRRGGHSASFGTTAAGPALAVPPPVSCSPVMSLSLNDGLLRRAAIPELERSGPPEGVRS